MSLDEKAEENYYRAIVDLLRIPRHKEVERILRNGEEYIQKWREIKELKNDI